MIAVTTLVDARLRLARAEEHLAELQPECSGFIASKPYRFFSEYDTDRRQTLLKFSVDRQPPDRIAIVAGDAIHSIRASLDYAAWTLNEAHGGSPNRQVKYPVLETALAFGNDKTVKNYAKVMPAVLSLMETTQPYKEAKGLAASPLWVLHKLDIRDKHITLNVAVAACQLASLHSSGMLGGFSIPSEYIEPVMYFGDNDPITVLAIEHPPDRDMEMNAKMIVQLVFEDAPATGRGVASTVQTLLAGAAVLISDLEKLMP
jgi:hypothetical protein